MKLVTLPTHSQFGLMAVIDTSGPQVARKLSVEAVFKAFRGGQFHQGWVSVKRTAIPNYDPQPWRVSDVWRYTITYTLRDTFVLCRMPNSFVSELLLFILF